MGLETTVGQDEGSGGVIDVGERPLPCQDILLRPYRDPRDPHAIGTAVWTKARLLPSRWYCQAPLRR